MRTYAAPMLRLALATSATLSLGLAGCSTTEAPTGAGSNATAVARQDAAAGALVLRPITGRCETAFNPPPFPLPPVHEQVDRGSCQMAHLGRSEFSGVQVIDFAAGTQSGERTFTAANGDVLRATHEGTSAVTGPGRVSFTATLTFVGGTGRFAHATGQATARGSASLATSTASFTLDGWIAYDGADGRGS